MAAPLGDRPPDRLGNSSYQAQGAPGEAGSQALPYKALSYITRSLESNTNPYPRNLLHLLSAKSAQKRLFENPTEVGCEVRRAPPDRKQKCSNVEQAGL